MKMHKDEHQKIFVPLLEKIKSLEAKAEQAEKEKQIIIDDLCDKWEELQKQYESALNCEGRLRDELEESDKFNDELMAKNSELLSQLEAYKVSVGAYKTHNSNLKDQNARLREALKDICKWLEDADDQPYEVPESKGGGVYDVVRIPHEIAKEALQQLSNQGE